MGSARGRKPTHGCNYPMVGWPSVILTPMGPSLNLTREGTSRPSLRSSLSLSHGFCALKCGSASFFLDHCFSHASAPMYLHLLLSDIVVQVNPRSLSFCCAMCIIVLLHTQELHTLVAQCIGHCWRWGWMLQFPVLQPALPWT